MAQTSKYHDAVKLAEQHEHNVIVLQATLETAEEGRHTLRTRVAEQAALTSMFYSKAVLLKDS